jgi:hypothetical protein
MHAAPPPPPPPQQPIIRVCDVECYRNYFLVKFYDIKTKQFYAVQMYAGCPLNLMALRLLLAGCTIVTFNGNKYDMLMISAALTGRFTNDQLKNLSNHIIDSGKFGKIGPPVQPWMIAQEWGFEIIQLDHIDLFELSPGDGSLKIYMGRLHSKKMQDLPYQHETILTREEMEHVNEYCSNDLLGTADLHSALLPDIETREELSEQYGMDMRSKSDAQIAEAAFKKLLNLDYRKSKAMTESAQLPPGSVLKYRGAPFLRFSTPELQSAYARVLSCKFIVSPGGQPLEPPELAGYEVKLGNAVYRMGIGGLHSSEEKVHYVAGPLCRLVDFDVGSYYPKIISILKLYPNQIGPIFLTIYDGWITVRLKYKKDGKKKKAATFKIKLNGTFGKTNSKYSIIFSPDMFLQIVLTGQMSLLMLIDMLHMAGIGTVQTNTDGVVTKCTDAQVATRDAIVKQWEALTGFEMEATEYAGIFSRDVNSYLAAKPAYTDDKGVYHPLEWKGKGPYADPGLAKNPSNIVCADAVKAFLEHGTPLEQTIRRCNDIRKFVTVRADKTGGAYWVKDTIVADSVGRKRDALTAAGWTGSGRGKSEVWFEPCGDNQPRTLEQAIAAIRADIPRQYLGKAVRWYYGAGQRGHIATTKGGLLARSEGAKPCMDLPDVLPCDIDYAWYIAEAQSLLQDLGVR